MSGIPTREEILAIQKFCRQEHHDLPVMSEGGGEGEFFRLANKCYTLAIVFADPRKYGGWIEACARHDVSDCVIMVESSLPRDHVQVRSLQQFIRREGFLELVKGRMSDRLKI